MLADEINSALKDVTKNLGINQNTYIPDNSNDITDPVPKAIDIFKNLPSILLIPSKVVNDSPFSFKEAFLCDIEKELRSLNPVKVCTFKRKLRNFGGYPAKALKQHFES